MSHDDTTDAGSGQVDQEAHKEHGHGHDHERDALLRQTAPQGEYTMSDVGLGLGIALAGMVLVFLIPFLLA